MCVNSFENRGMLMKKMKLKPIIVYSIIGGILILILSVVLFSLGKRENRNSVSIGEQSGSLEEISGLESSGQETPKENEEIPPYQQKRVVAYFTSWPIYLQDISVFDIDAGLITHINYAFANVSADGTVIVGDSWADVENDFGKGNAAAVKGYFGQLREFKKQHPHIKTLISIGGYTWSGQFSNVAADEGKRKRFVAAAVEFILQYGFDGIDIDWEYPVEGNEVPHRPQDKQNYTKLIKELREALDAQAKKDSKTYLLSIAGGANLSFVKNTQLKELMHYLDYINVMTYDYHGSWEQVANHNAPLYSNPKDPTDSNLGIDDTIRAYLEAGVKPQDLNLGLAFYGRGWEGVTNNTDNGLFQKGQTPKTKGFGTGTYAAGVFDFWDLQANYVNKSGFKRYWDDVAKVPYLYNGNVFISYDDAESIGYKLRYADEKGLGGVMFWEFSGDKEKLLQKVIANHYNKKQ